MSARVVTGALLAACVAGPSLRADDVFLVGGGRLSGQIVERRADALVIDVGPGRVTLPSSRIVRVVPGRSAVAVYRERAARLASQDVAGWLELGRWARENDLLTQAREAFERALAAQADNQTAHLALGHVRVAGRWMTEEESYQARGYVQFEGTWMTPAQVQATSAQRTAEAEARRAAWEAEARAAEAEARIRVAEAEAARAAYEAESAPTDGGIPYSWIFAPPYGYGPVVGLVSIKPPHRRHDGHARRGGDRARFRRDQGAAHQPAPQPDPPPSRSRPVRGSVREVPGPKR